MEWFFLLIAMALFIIGALAQVLVVVGLPGVWVILGLAALVEFAVDRLYLPAESMQTFSWWVLIGCVVLAIAGDLFEWIAGALGAKVGGGTRRGMWGALIGGLVGAIAFTPIFSFLPVIGTLCGALLGTFLGAMIGEMSHDHTTTASTLRPATGATLGRVLGTFTKLGVSVTVWLVLSVAAFWP